MPLDIESQTMELLTTTVEDEKRSITYRWLSRSMGYSVNTAKQLMESYLSTLGKGKVHGTYYVARQDPQTGNQTISLVSQEELQGAKEDSAVIGYHIYSLEPSLIKDLAILSVANSEASQIQKGKDVNVYRVVQNKDVTTSEYKPRPSPSSSSAAKAPAPAKALATPTPAPASTFTPASTSTSAGAASKGSKPAAKSSSVMSFFGKAATAPSKTPTTSSSSAPASKTPTPAAKPNQQKRKADSMISSANDNGVRNNDNNSSDEEVDSEEERDRRLALSSRLDQDQDVAVKEEGPAANKDTLKRPRSAKLLAIDDDDEIEDEEPVVKNGPAADRDEEEDESVESLSLEERIALSKEKEAQRLALENMMLMDDDPNVEMQGEDSIMADSEEVGSSTAAQNEGASSETPKRRRGRRTVMKRKTYRNERGYMVTEDYAAVESFSEDETPAPAPAPARVEKAAQPVKGKTEGTTGAKKKAGSGNQSLLNFFAKK